MRALVQEACQGPVRDAVAQHAERLAQLNASDLRPLTLRDFQVRQWRPGIPVFRGGGGACMLLLGRRRGHGHDVDAVCVPSCAAVPCMGPRPAADSCLTRAS